MHAAYTDIEAEVSGSEDNSQDNSLFDEEGDNMMEDFIDDDETMEDEGTHVAMDMDNAALEAEQTREFAQRLQERLSQVQRVHCNAFPPPLFLYHKPKKNNPNLKRSVQRTSPLGLRLSLCRISPAST